MPLSPSLGSEREVVLSGGPVRLRERGSGPTVVFVHAFPAGGDEWRDVVPLLGDGRRCITPDWPFGVHHAGLRCDADLSPEGIGDLIAELLDVLDLRDVTLVGSGGGGALCQVAVARHPDRVGRLVLLTGDAFEHFPAPRLRPFVALLSLPGGARVVAELTRSTALARAALRICCRRPPPPDLVRAYGRALRRPEILRDVRRAIRGVRRRGAEAVLDAAGRLTAFDRPALIVWSQEDLLFPLDDARRLAALLPDARLHILDGCRTLIAEDRPERLAALLDGFVPGG